MVFLALRTTPRTQHPASGLHYGRIGSRAVLLDEINELTEKTNEENDE
jgi:hypothetical protein